MGNKKGSKLSDDPVYRIERLQLIREYIDDHARYWGATKDVDPYIIFQGFGQDYKKPVEYTKDHKTVVMPEKLVADHCRILVKIGEWPVGEDLLFPVESETFVRLPDDKNVYACLAHTSFKHYQSHVWIECKHHSTFRRYCREYMELSKQHSDLLREKESREKAGKVVLPEPPKKALVIDQERREHVIYGRVSEKVKQFFEGEKEKSGARNMGEYLEALSHWLQK